MINRKKIFLSLLCIVIPIFALGSSARAQAPCSGTQIFTANNCEGDANSAEETALFEIVNKYRVANGRPALRPSVALSVLANRRILDLKQNMKSLTHSWSNCPYDIKDEKSWPCVIDAPKRLNSGYKGQGYETLYRTSTGNATPPLAVDAWKKSTLHNSIILNQGMFKEMPWDEVGVAIDGQFAALWFGYPGRGSKGLGQSAIGLGVSYDQAVAGLSKILSMDEAASTVENNTWRGLSADRKIELEIYGTRKEIGEASLGIKMKLEANQKLESKSQLALATLLKNLFPEWPDVDAWIETSVEMISRDPTAFRTKLVRKIAVELRSSGVGSLKLSVKPQSKPSYVEVF